MGGKAVLLLVLGVCAVARSTAFVVNPCLTNPLSWRALGVSRPSAKVCSVVMKSMRGLGGESDNELLGETLENSPESPRRRFLSQSLSAQLGAALILSRANSASALGNPFQGLTDECEVDACINRDRRILQRAGRKFTITQEFDKNGSKSTGSAVWEGDFVLTKYMETALPAGFWKGKRVLELGAGTGLASMVAAILGAEEVLLTDGDSKVLELADRNLKANLTPEEAARIKLKQLKWEWAADPSWKLDAGGAIDVVLAADLTYYRDNIPPLMRMMQAISAPPTLLLLTHTIRPTDGDSMQQFYSAFDVEKLASGPAFGDAAT